MPASIVSKGGGLTTYLNEEEVKSRAERCYVVRAMPTIVEGVSSL